MPLGKKSDLSFLTRDAKRARLCRARESDEQRWTRLTSGREKQRERRSTKNILETPIQQLRIADIRTLRPIIDKGSSEKDWLKAVKARMHSEKAWLDSMKVRLNSENVWLKSMKGQLVSEKDGLDCKAQSKCQKDQACSEKNPFISEKDPFNSEKDLLNSVEVELNPNFCLGETPCLKYEVSINEDTMEILGA